MPRIFKTETTSADARGQQVINLAKTTGRSAKSTFSKRVWKADMVLVVTGFDFVYDESELNTLLAENPTENPDVLAQSLRTYPVLTTALVRPDNTTVPYNPLWLKTLLVDIEDANGDEHPVNGTLNVLAKQKFEESATDEATLQAIVSALSGKRVQCIRKTPIKRDYYGRTRTEKLCEFDIV